MNDMNHHDDADTLQARLRDAATLER